MPLVSDNTTPVNYTIQDVCKIIEAQQSTINKLTLELAKRNQIISRDSYEKCLNDLETEKYEHAKTKLALMESNDKNNHLIRQVEQLQAELDKERKAYSNVFSLLKDKALNESNKSIDMIERIAHTEVRYNEALQNITEKDKQYSKLFDKVKRKEITYEQKITEMNLKAEQDKYISKLLQESVNKPNKKKK